MEELIRDTFRGTFEKELIEEIITLGKLVSFQEGEVLIEIGTYLKTMPLLINGAIKIMREDFDAGELVLYFLEKGETCSMSLSCCMGDKQSEIRAVAETKGTLVLIPIAKMEEWLGKYKSWRSFVFESYNHRFNEMLTAIDSIAFMHMDERLYNYLQEKSKINASNIVSNTNQEIADELNSSRVVISRLLKAFEREGKIKLNRNNIELLN